MLTESAQAIVPTFFQSSGRQWVIDEHGRAQPKWIMVEFFPMSA